MATARMRTMTTSESNDPNPAAPQRPASGNAEDDELRRYLKMGDRHLTGCIGTCDDCTPECPVYDALRPTAAKDKPAP